eukprot:XP_008190098.1 PREDICTED: uncharacterized protein K02A2.6-like [Acyrthosiphon pisum]
MEFRPPKEMSFADNISEQWKEWYQQFSIFLIASGKAVETDERKINILLNLIGTHGIKIYNNFKKPKKATDITYDNVVKWFSDYCEPRKNVIFQRYKFGSCVQKEGQTFDEFVTELKTLSSLCEYKEEDNMVRDRIVFGIRDAETKNKLLSMDNLTLEKAETLCRTREVTDKEIQEMTTDLANIHYMGREQKTWSKNKGECYDCKKCGTNHKPRSCPAFGKECRVCNKLNHYEIGCKNKSKKVYKTSVTHEITNNDVSAFDEFSVNEITEQICNIDVNQKSWIEEIKIGNMWLKFKLDTGSDINIIPYDDFIKLEPQPNLTNSKYNIEAYGGFKINSIGSCVINCLFKKFNRNCSVEFLVVKTENNKTLCPILGLPTCDKINLIKRINELEVDTKNNWIMKNMDVFTGLGQFPELYNLELVDNFQPKIVPYRRVPIAVKDRYELKLKTLIDQGVVDYVNRPTDWTNHVVVIEKPNKTLRICLDPQHLNKNIKDEQFPIPTLNEIVPKLKNKKFFTVLDLKDGFWQIGLTESSSNLCSFASPLGTLKFLKLPFGLKIAPSVFQRYNTKYFGDIKGLIIYFDDFIIAADTKQEHDKIVDELLNRARKYNVKFNKEKIQYCKDKVTFLGHLFDQKGMSLNPSRIEAIKNLKPPNNRKELQRLLGFINYVRSFIPNFSELTAPLRNLLKKNTEWQWTSNQMLALERIKEKLMNAPVLSSFDPNKSITIQTDSSQSGLGCCLLQNKQPIAYASRSLTSNETQWAQIEKEMAAILFACKKMFIADYLSRDYIDSGIKDDESINDYVHMINTKNIKFSNDKLIEFINETKSDPVLGKVLDYYMYNWPLDKTKLPNLDELRYLWNKRNDITVNNGLVYLNDKLIVPVKLRKILLNILHETHLGITKTIKLAKNFYHWPYMSKDIENYISNCYLCAKYQRKNSKEMLLNHDLPKRSFEKIGIDIADFGGNYYLIICDYYSRWLEILKIQDKSANSIVSVLKPIFSRFGIPNYCVSDNVPFNSYPFKQFSIDWNFKSITTSPNYPQSNGLVEKGVGIAKDMMRKCVETGQDLELYLLNYRSSPVAGLKYSPAEILQNRKIKTKLPVNEKTLFPKIPKNLYSEMKVNQSKQQDYYNKGTQGKEKVFKKGDSVLWLKNNVWEVGIIVGKAETPRSYILQDLKGRIFRRTSVHLKMNKTNVTSDTSKQKESVVKGLVKEDNRKTSPKEGRCCIVVRN